MGACILPKTANVAEANYYRGGLMDIALWVAILGVGGTIIAQVVSNVFANRREAQRQEHERELKQIELEDKRQEQRREERRQVYKEYYLVVNKFISRDWWTAGRREAMLHPDRDEE